MSIKIFITYHDEHPLIKSEILTPIQTGCANTDKRFKGMVADDAGDNISALNDRYCELSAQYWVWKNYEEVSNPDYVGFMHYRRHFMFDGWSGNPDWCWLPKGNVYFVSNITPQYMFHLTDDKIKRTLADCDCLVIKPYDVKNLDSADIRTQFCKLPKQQAYVFDTFIATAKELYPQYKNEIQKIEHGSVQYLCNMFVMRKKLFFEYSQFCFDVLQAVDKKIDSSKMDAAASRFLGYLGEFLLSIYVFHLKKRKNIKIKELNATYILSDTPMKLNHFKYWKYKILSKITWGKKKERCRKKYQYWKAVKKELNTLDTQKGRVNA